jgi:hypothetical protein
MSVSCPLAAPPPQPSTIFLRFQIILKKLTETPKYSNLYITEKKHKMGVSVRSTALLTPFGLSLPLPWGECGLRSHRQGPLDGVCVKPGTSCN